MSSYFFVKLKELVKFRKLFAPTVRRYSFSSNGPNNYSSRLKHYYRHAFGKYMLLTNIGSSGILMLIGDFCQQEIEYQKHQLAKRYDYRRSFHMFVVGLSQGPLHHYFYGWMDRMLPQKNFISVLKKIGLDQFVMSPVCITDFFVLLALMEMKPFSEWTRELTEKFLEVYTVDWMVWPPTQFINFYFLPVKYQVVYINFITMLYNIFLSYVKYRKAEQSRTND